MRRLPRNRVLSLVAFAVAMGYLEAVVVLYLRHLGGMATPTPGDLTTLMSRLPEWVLPVEETREAATILMLAALAVAVGRTGREKLCVFLLTFGVWDVSYYFGLKALLGWPPSLLTLDCLFLIPVPWLAPVWLPLLASTFMIALALWLYPRGRRQ